MPNILGGARKQVPIHAFCAAGWLCVTALMSYCAARITSLNQETKTIYSINSHIRVVKICALGAHHYIGHLFAVEYERQTNSKRIHCRFEKDGSPSGTESG